MSSTNNLNSGSRSMNGLVNITGDDITATNITCDLLDTNNLVVNTSISCATSVIGDIYATNGNLITLNATNGLFTSITGNTLALTTSASIPSLSSTTINATNGLFTNLTTTNFTFSGTFTPNLIVQSAGAGTNILKATTFLADGDLTQSGTGILNQSSGTGTNLMKAITLNGGANIVQSGTGILNQSSGSGTNLMKAITMNTGTDLNMSSTGIINQSTGTVINLMNQITLNSGRNIVQSGASRINQSTATATNLFTTIIMNANANISQSGTGILSQTGAGTNSIKNTLATRLTTENTSGVSSVVIYTLTASTSGTDTLATAFLAPVNSYDSVKVVVPVAGFISGSGDSNPTDNLTFALTSGHQAIIYKNGVLFQTKAITFAITRRFSFNNTAPTTGDALQYLGSTEITFTPDFTPEGQSPDSYEVYVKFFFTGTVPLFGNSTITNVNLQINTTQQGFNGTRMTNVNATPSPYVPASVVSVASGLSTGVNIQSGTIRSELGRITSLQTSGMGVYLYNATNPAIFGQPTNFQFIMTGFYIMSASSSDLRFTSNLTQNALGGSGGSVVGTSTIIDFADQVNFVGLPFGYGIIGYTNTNYGGAIIINVSNFTSKNLNIVQLNPTDTMSSAKIYFNGEEIN